MIHICNVPRYQAPSAEELAKMKAAHVLLGETSYEKTPLHRGYTDKILTINVGDRTAKISDIPEEVKEKFTGKFTPDYIIPKAFDPRVKDAVAAAVAQAARDTGVARI